MICVGTNFSIDFEKVKINEVSDPGSVDLVSKIDGVNQACDAVCDLTKNWHSSSNIRDTASKTTLESLDSALYDVSTSLKDLYDIYDYSKTLKKSLFELFIFYVKKCKEGQKDKKYTVNMRVGDNWVLLKKIAETLYSILKLDRIKSNKPEIQNELSLIKRILNTRTDYIKKYSMRMRSITQSDESEEEKSESRNDDKYLENLKKWEYPENMDWNVLIAMARFYISPTPFIASCVSRLSLEFQKEENYYMDDIITELPNIYLEILKEGFLKSEEKEVYKSGMVTSAIIADRLVPDGIFHKKSDVEVIGIYSYLQIESDTMLLKQLQFWSMHFNDDTTLNKIKKKFE